MRPPHMHSEHGAGDIGIQDHYGLEDVKERILEHIAVNFLQAGVFSFIIRNH